MNKVLTTIVCVACTAISSQQSHAAILSPAELAIRKAEREIAVNPSHYPFYNSLAMAYARRARETSDVHFYRKAEDALTRSFGIKPENFEGLKTEAWLLLGRHEFARARELATRLNQRNPDDVSVYGYLVDANAELGNYDEAVRAAQWMLNLRPGNVAGLTRAAYLRELHGDLPGAMELMQSAYDSVGSHETEDRAWILTQLSHLYLLSGDINKAEIDAEGALNLFPNYHYALGALAQVRLAQKRGGEAVALFEKRYQESPHPENLFALAEALREAGADARAAVCFEEFRQKAEMESHLADNANREFVAYLVDVQKDPPAALAIAERERARRHDVFTRDAYAWALASSGQYSKADAEIRQVIALGIKDPRVLYHAGVIALKLRRTRDAQSLLKDAASRYSRDAADLLATLSAPTGVDQVSRTSGAMAP